MPKIPEHCVAGRFTIERKGRRLPLALIPCRNGYGHQSAYLCYSDHEGLEALKIWAEEFLGISGQEAAFAMNRDALWGMASILLHEPVAALCGPGEFVWHTHHMESELAAAIAAGVVADTGRRVDQGFLRDLPVVKFTCAIDPDTGGKAADEAPGED